MPTEGEREQMLEPENSENQEVEQVRASSAAGRRAWISLKATLFWQLLHGPDLLLLITPDLLGRYRVGPVL